MLLLKSILFTILFPGSVTVLGPYLILSRMGAGAMGGRSLARYAGLFPICVGAGILLRCVRDFAVVGRGTLAPVDPPKKLVVRGLYRYARNPMYVGVVSILLGEALLFWSAPLLVYAAAYFVIVHLFVVFYEEPTLRRTFADSYEEYRRAVNRWWPKPPSD